MYNYIPNRKISQTDETLLIPLQIVAHRNNYDRIQPDVKRVQNPPSKRSHRAPKRERKKRKKEERKERKEREEKKKAIRRGWKRTNRDEELKRKQGNETLVVDSISKERKTIYIPGIISITFVITLFDISFPWYAGRGCTCSVLARARSRRVPRALSI